MADRGRPPQQPEESGELLDDLESIKDLLNEEDVPLLQDIEPAQPGTESTADDSDRPTTVQLPGQHQLTELLSDAWADSVQRLFDDARAQIEANAGQWLPEQTEELSTALKIRLDLTVRDWLTQTLRTNITQLQDQIVKELSAEIDKHTEHLGVQDT